MAERTLIVNDDAIEVEVCVVTEGSRLANISGVRQESPYKEVPGGHDLSKGNICQRSLSKFEPKIPPVIYKLPAVGCIPIAKLRRAPGLLAADETPRVPYTD